MGTSVILAAYKEAENLKILLPRVQEIFAEMQEPYEILVIDAATPQDDTEAVCKAFSVRYIPQEEPFYGGAFRTGLRYAQMDRIFTMDADGSHDPAVFPAMHRKFAEGFDIVIGSRYVKNGSSTNAKSSIVLSKILNTVMRICLGVKAKDISNSNRLYDANLLKSVKPMRKHNDIQQEVILRMKIEKHRRTGQKLRIGEVPIVFHKRIFGESKRHQFTVIRGFIVSVFYFSWINLKSKFERQAIRAEQTETREEAQ
jgi:dolichol-phosphate mannosyltransferase